MRKILILSVVAIALLCSVFSAFGYSVSPEPHGKICQDIGVLNGLTTSPQINAGTLYYKNTTNPYTVDLPKNVLKDGFEFGVYDNDGTPYTHYDFQLFNVSIYNINMFTQNNKWSDFVDIGQADKMVVTPPNNHESTWLCFVLKPPTVVTVTPSVANGTATATTTVDVITGTLTPSTGTPTPTAPVITETSQPLTLTPTPTRTPDASTGNPLPSGDVSIALGLQVNSPTGLEPVVEPSDVDSVIAVYPGYAATVSVRITNKQITMYGVHVFGYGVDETFGIMNPYQEYTFQVSVPIISGTNKFEYQVTTDNVDINPLDNTASIIIEAENCDRPPSIDVLTQYRTYCESNRSYLPLTAK